MPCFNEERRLACHELKKLVVSGARLILVDDGSTDATPHLLESLRSEFPKSISTLRRPTNGGKAHAVRDGMRAAVELDRGLVGYYDADGATPAVEMQRLAQAASDPDVSVVLGARVLLLGRDIQRRQTRHYLGRLFAGAASIVLKLPVYDTQCGAKLFRVSPELNAALQEPFYGRWVFDVELVGRLLAGSASTSPVPTSAFVEVPLTQWRDISGSRVSTSDMLGAGVDLIRLWHQFRSMRRRGHKA